MSESLHIPTYFETHAFALARAAGATALQYDVEKLQGFSVFAHESLGVNLPPLESTAMVMRYSRGSGTVAKFADSPLKEAQPADRLFIPESALSGEIEDPARETLADVEADGRKAFEFRISDLQKPLTESLAETLAWPAPEDSKLIPSGGFANAALAWGRQVKEAFDSNKTPAKKKEFIAEASVRFGGAIILKRNR